MIMFHLLIRFLMLFINLDAKDVPAKSPSSISDDIELRNRKTLKTKEKSDSFTSDTKKLSLFEMQSTKVQLRRELLSIVIEVHLDNIDSETLLTFRKRWRVKSSIEIVESFSSWLEKMFNRYQTFSFINSTRRLLCRYLGFFFFWKLEKHKAKNIFLLYSGYYPETHRKIDGELKSLSKPEFNLKYSFLL